MRLVDVLKYNFKKVMYRKLEDSLLDILLNSYITFNYEMVLLLLLSNFNK